MTDLFNLSVKGNGFGVDIDYTIVKDFCQKYELDEINIYRHMKNIKSKVYAQES